MNIRSLTHFLTDTGLPQSQRAKPGTGSISAPQSCPRQNTPTIRKLVACPSGFAALLILCALAHSALAATSTAWEISGFNDFLKGRLRNLSLTSDGILQPGPGIEWNAALNQPAAWSVASAPGGSLYIGCGHQGKVVRVARDGKTSTVFSGQQSEVFAVASDTKGNIYFGTSPNGGLYHVESGAAKEIWHAPAKYIWAIVAAPDGTLYVGAGEPGQIFHVTPSGSATLFYDTQQMNVTALAMGPANTLLAGTDPNGILYQITAPQKATILYDSSLPEIRSIAVDPSGNIYAAAMGGAVSSRGAGGGTAATQAVTAVTATSPTVITVTEAQSADNEPSAVKGAATDAGRNSGMATASGTTTAGVVEVSGAEKAAIYRITPDRTVETIRSSKEENFYDLTLDGDAVWFATDDHGRIYKMEGSHTSLIAEPGDGEATRITKIGNRFYALLSNPGRLIAFSGAGMQPATYESPVHDASSVARWGHLQWYGAGTGVKFQTRTGNSARPDATWSEWADPQAASSLISSPIARFIQWRAEWPAKSAAILSTVDVPFLPQNGPPAVRSITVTAIVGTNAQKSAQPASNSAAYSITVTDTGEAPAASSATSASQSVSRLQSTQTQISWQADDPDGDKLAYSIYFRPEGATVWQLVRSRMFENTLLLDPDVFADGRYYFKVTASDSPSNSAAYARESELVSSLVLIDNTPPVVILSQPVRDGATLDLDADAKDNTSPLRLSEFSVDAGSWQPVEAVDGVTDSPQERFHIHIEKLKPGEHLIVVRVYDSANNAGLGRIILR